MKQQQNTIYQLAIAPILRLRRNGTNSEVNGSLYTIGIADTITIKISAIIETQWEKPPEWDSIHPLYIPISNYNYEGFFKESANGYDIGSTVNNEEENYKLSASDIEAKVETFLTRPARRQMDPEESKKNALDS